MPSCQRSSRRSAARLYGVCDGRSYGGAAQLQHVADSRAGHQSREAGALDSARGGAAVSIARERTAGEAGSGVPFSARCRFRPWLFLAHAPVPAGEARARHQSGVLGGEAARQCGARREEPGGVAGLRLEGVRDLGMRDAGRGGTGARTGARHRVSARNTSS